MADDEEWAAPEDMEIATRIRDRRIALGLTQKDLGDAINKSQTYVTKVEGHKRAVQLDVLRAIAPALQVSVAWLLSGAVGDSLPVDSTVDEAGHLTPGPSLLGAVLGLATPVLAKRAVVDERIPVLSAAPGWAAVRVVSETPLVVSLDLTRPVAHDLRAGDVLVLRPPVEGEELAGRLVWATRGEDEAFESELRVYREIDRAPWLWPVSKRQRPEPLEGWALRGVVVEQRRKT